MGFASAFCWDDLILTLAIVLAIFVSIGSPVRPSIRELAVFSIV